MLLPVRCFTCGKVLKQEFLTKVQDVPPSQFSQIMQECGVMRPCCRKIVKFHVDLCTKIMSHPLPQLPSGLERIQTNAEEPRIYSGR